MPMSMTMPMASKIIHSGTPRRVGAAGEGVGVGMKEGVGVGVALTGGLGIGVEVGEGTTDGEGVEDGEGVTVGGIIIGQQTSSGKHVVSGALAPVSIQRALVVTSRSIRAR